MGPRLLQVAVSGHGVCREADMRQLQMAFGLYGMADKAWTPVLYMMRLARACAKT